MAFGGLGLEGWRGVARGPRKGASEEVSGPEEQKIPWEARRGLFGAASGGSLDSGETREGQALLEGCRELVYSGKSQVLSRWEVERNSLR